MAWRDAVGVTSDMGRGVVADLTIGVARRGGRPDHGRGVASVMTMGGVIEIESLFIVKLAPPPLSTSSCWTNKAI